MTAVAVHQIAAWIFKRDESLHKNDGVISYKRPDDESNKYYREPDPYPTLFYHSEYTYHEQYPKGVADMVGYWAENRILGGVALFGRKKAGLQGTDIYFHSDRNQVTFRIYKLLDSQIQTLLDFLLLSNAPTTTTCPLPILGDKNNRDRIDPGDAIDCHGVFRDHWERKIPVKDD
ncbi:hypothetical protein B7463_g11106, partial [Scytalidium lignicola]